jgi:pyruvate,water dikinase
MKGWFKDLVRSFESSQKVSVTEALQSKYSLFQTLLKMRKETSEMVTRSLQSDLTGLMMRAHQVLQNLDELTGQAHPDLFARLEQMAKRDDHGIREELQELLDSVHDLAIEEISAMADKYNTDAMPVKKVRTGLPINLHVLDLDGGLQPHSGKLIAREQILSLPLKALFRGMYYPGITWSGPIGLNLKGLMVIMAQSSSRPEEDFWDKTLALIASEYMSYYSRLGYHYATVDACSGEVSLNNHIRFTFKGGAADDVRRARRARFIGAVLERMGFESQVREDWVCARYCRQPRTETEGKLDMLGRLMGCSRQRDMVMNNDEIVDWHVEAFLRGNYSFNPE